MELAHLDGNAGKGVHKPSSCITDDPHHIPSTMLKLLHAADVFRNCFVRKKRPEEILVMMRTPEHHHAEDFSEVRRIHHHDDIAHVQKTRLNHRQIHLLLHPPPASFELPPNLRVGLFSMCIYFQNPLRISSFLLTEFLPAITTLPSLPTLVRSIPLD